jgi:hypothetical protein
MFKFTIREAILMTTIVAVALMWWMEKYRSDKFDARLTAIETRLQAIPVVQVPVTVRSMPSRTVTAAGQLTPVPPTVYTPAPPTAYVPVAPAVIRPAEPIKLIPPYRTESD